MTPPGGEREREVYRLRVSEGLTLRQIAQRFGIGPERVRQLLCRYVRQSTGRPVDAKAMSRAAAAVRRAARAQELAKLGCAIREAREQRGLSERELADAIRGISPAGIRAVEAGKCDIDYERLTRLADALGVKLSTIILRANSLGAE